jgi:hypothetical protein
MDRSIALCANQYGDQRKDEEQHAQTNGDEEDRAFDPTASGKNFRLIVLAGQTTQTNAFVLQNQRIHVVPQVLLIIHKQADYTCEGP